ncbi:phage/plasmid primase, P4 family [Lactobacillus amylolyticus]|uniref:phage/plasmid primase, P4 family n=1 Tax=Lactobacillus amylolyticus TaxID=83683 RepID=UPI002490C844|nr:phage/plasmid primase, P4 family [Lactobacillus amylolyticus]
MYEKIPDELRKLTQWGVFRKRWIESRKKYTKIPVSPWDGKAGKSNDKSTWADFHTALLAIDKYKCDGLAFYFANGYVGLDIDHIKGDLEELEAGNRSSDNEIIKTSNLAKGTYMEISLSGEGIHCIFKGKIPGNRRRKGNYEIYESGRFFALTGNSMNHEPRISTLNQDEMKKLYVNYLGEDKVVPFNHNFDDQNFQNDLSIPEIIRRAEDSKTGARFKFFMQGGWEQFYPSQSEADLAFANDLVFWCGRDFEKMDTIFRNSSLMRGKYDEKHGKTTYGIGLLNKAINENTSTFNPHREPLKYNFGFIKKEKEIPPRSWDDTGNADRFCDMWGDSVRYSFIDKSWYVYDGEKWAADDTGQVKKCADKVIERMPNEKIKVADGVGPEDAKKDFAKFIKKSRSNAAKNAMLDEVKHRVPVLHDEFDKEAMLLNTKSGYVDLASGILHDHDIKKMFSHETNCEYTDTIDCPEWNQFLKQIFDNNEDLIHYIQKAIGYSATGSTREQIMFVLYGNGRNGKSIFIDTLADILGDYARTMNVSTIMVKANNGVNTDIARLEGARLVISSEANEGSRLDEGLVKQMTGGDKLVARYLYGKEFEFIPQFKIWMATNHKPLIRGTDDGIWRRIVLIPFMVQIPIEKVDKDLKSKLKREASGILNWIVDGALAWQKEGLEPPEIVKNASKDYRNEMDVLSYFISECCEIGSGIGFKAQAGELYGKYKSWAEENSEYKMSSQKFGREMRKKFKYVRKMNGRFYIGLKIITDSRLNFLKN